MAPLYKTIPQDYDGSTLYEFLFEHGQNKFNFCPEEYCRQHFDDLATGKTLGWAGFEGGDNSNRGKCMGFITAMIEDCYPEHQKPGDGPCAEIGEYTVHPDMRGQGMGTTLSRAAITGLFEGHPEVMNVLVIIHHENIASKKSLMKAGFKELATFDEPHKNRRSCLLRIRRPEWVKQWAVKAGWTRVLGIQSGNAIDGIDTVCVDFAPPVVREAASTQPKVDSLKYKVVGFRGTDWDPEARKLVFAIRTGEPIKLEDILHLHHFSAECFAEALESLILCLGVPRHTVSLISSHGQTIHGHPHWEIGEPQYLAERTGITTVADFRPGDMAAGGNGSPCTCTFDAMMLRPQSGTKWRVCVNIGGTSSATFCPPVGDTPVSGLDPGLGVLFYDWAVRDHDSTMEYDRDGAIARKGTAHEGLLSEMIKGLPHFQREELPISVGPDDFPRATFDKFQARSRELKLSINDWLATLVELTTRTIANACRFCPTKNVLPEVVVRGGVRHNSYFIERFRTHLSTNLGVPVTIVGLDGLGFGEDADDTWETVLYAMMGFLCASNLPNFVPSTTGASRAVSGGKICLAPGRRGVVEHGKAAKPQAVAGRGYSAGRASVTTTGYPTGYPAVAAPRVTNPAMVTRAPIGARYAAGPLGSQTFGAPAYGQRFAAGSLGVAPLGRSVGFTQGMWGRGF